MGKTMGKTPMMLMDGYIRCYVLEIWMVLGDGLPQFSAILIVHPGSPGLT